MKAKDIMSGPVLSLSPGHSIVHAAQIMLENRISALPVIDDEARLVGIVTEGDLIRHLEISPRPLSDFSVPGAWDEFIKAYSWRVGDVMTNPVVTVGPETSVEEMAALLRTHKIKRVPVVSDGLVVGMVSRRDLLRVIARIKPQAIAAGDDALRLCVAARLNETLHLSPPPTVTVVNGIIHLGGAIRDETERRVIKVIVDGVPGAGGVEDRMQVRPAAAN